MNFCFPLRKSRFFRFLPIANPMISRHLIFCYRETDFRSYLPSSSILERYDGEDPGIPMLSRVGSFRNHPLDYLIKLHHFGNEFLHCRAAVAD